MGGSKGLGFVAGLIVGGLAGVAATIIFGPELNEETRRRLREEGSHWRERAMELSNRARAQAEETVDRGRELVDQQRSRLEDAIAEGKEAAAEKQREMLAKWQQAERQGEAEL